MTDSPRIIDDDPCLPQLAAPSLHLPSETDDYGDGYPFSVAPDSPLTPQDLMRFQRDHYEGTPFDLTQGIAGTWVRFAWQDGCRRVGGYHASRTPEDKAVEKRHTHTHAPQTTHAHTLTYSAGPYGDPNRYDPAANALQNVTRKEANSGFYERSISLFR